MVIVTTKQGKAGKVQVNFYNSVTIENVRDWAPIMTASEYIDFRRWAFTIVNPQAAQEVIIQHITNDRDILSGNIRPICLEQYC